MPLSKIQTNSISSTANATFQNIVATRIGIGTASNTSFGLINRYGGNSELATQYGTGTISGIGAYATEGSVFVETAGSARKFPVVWKADTGYVNMPHQPTFWTCMNGADTYSGVGWSRARLVAGQTASFNESYIDFTNMRFTAPVAGKYYFSAAITMSGSTNTDGTIGFTKNGQTSPDNGRSTAYASGTGLGGMDCAYIMNLAAGDYVSVYFYQSGTQVTRNTQYAGYFSGFLIG
jgi:hypothetical protein